MTVEVVVTGYRASTRDIAAFRISAGASSPRRAGFMADMTFYSHKVLMLATYTHQTA